MSDFQMPVYIDEVPSRDRGDDFDELPSLQEFMNSLDPKRREFIEKLPTLSEDDLKGLNQADSFCPICYNTFGAILAEAELASALDTPAVAAQHLGVTRLAETCGHVFCRKDITTWIERNDRCPSCRTPFYEGPESIGTGAPNLSGLQTFTLGHLMPAGFDQFLRSAAAGAHGINVPTQGAPETPEPPSAQSNTEASPAAGGPAVNANDAPNTRDGTTSASSGVNSNTTSANSQRAENDAEVARMMERMRGLGQAAALSDIMFGMSAVASRARQQQRQEPDDDRNEYAGLYS
ncbi:hypothetical protein SCHPADRAFT_939094 [Schizopora paradoxa]|uniref:RING-type domain-containing protein n=1 Tax=Schizopora paradoxa TaxID=27342 RepID=A0A0H2RT24_9AGAM|nr:hypothetical protein SCHPADRAFT_939094 [Schizopora paradoxa]